MKKRHAFFGGLCLFLSGAVIGFLIGMSASPILNAVVTGLLTVITALVTAMAGLNAAGPTGEAKAPDASRWIMAAPLALFLVGLLPGALTGLTARTHDWFGADPKALVKKWSGVGLKEPEIAQRLFDQLYGPAASGKPGSGSAALPGALYANVAPDECARFHAALDEAELRRFLQNSASPHVREFERRCKDGVALRAAMEELICSEK